MSGFGEEAPRTEVEAVQRVARVLPEEAGRLRRGSRVSALFEDMARRLLRAHP